MEKKETAVPGVFVLEPRAGSMSHTMPKFFQILAFVQILSKTTNLFHTTAYSEGFTFKKVNMHRRSSFAYFLVAFWM